MTSTSFYCDDIHAGVPIIYQFNIYFTTSKM